MTRLRAASPYVLAAVLAGAGSLHLLRPELFDALVPPILPPCQRAWTYASGVAELAVATAVAVPATRQRGGLAAAALFLAVFPGNVYMAVEPDDVPRWAALARLPLQVPLVLWGLQVAGKMFSTGRR
ncbi:MAG: hypothetical protein JWN08_2415 [Frankiales bacterium]|nr:hypothetical protein [Frankiales bacterium]